MRTPVRHVCPVCGRDAPTRTGTPPNASFPFCSPACKMVDLGRWLDGSYRIPLDDSDGGEGDAMEPGRNKDDGDAE